MNKKRKLKNLTKGLAWWYVSLFVLIVVAGSTLIAVGIYILLAATGAIDTENLSTVAILACALIACGIAGAFITGIISRTFTRPVEECINAINSLAEGDYSSRLDTSKGRDQIKSLKMAINKTAEELGNTEVMRNSFVNDVSHEYKTPVASILGYARLLKGSGLDEKQSGYVDIIIEESRHLATMTTNVLLLNKLENTGIVTDKSVFSLDESLRQCFVHLQSEWMDKDISIAGDFEDVSCYGNEDLMKHIWGNIAQNAIKFTDKGGEISCTVKQEGDNAVIIIKDNGCGMDEETLKHIFDKFYQKEGSGRTEGNGLGLALAKKAADLCGCGISVKSEPNCGTEFTITVPADLPDEEGSLSA